MSAEDAVAAPPPRLAATAAMLRWLRRQWSEARHGHAPQAPAAADELQRLAALERYGILDTDAEDAFDLLAVVAAEMTGSAHAFINFVDRHRVWTKATTASRRGELPREEDYCSLAIREPLGLEIEDLRLDARTHALDVTSRNGWRMYCGANLITPDGFRIGALCVLDTAPRRLSEHQRDLLHRLARQVIALLELRRKQRDLLEAQAELTRLAHTDALTGLANRRAWEHSLAGERCRAARHGTHHAMLLLDIDHFKRINDRHGHAAGDKVLAAVGALLSQRLRRLDTAARLGGEEFGVLLPQTALPQAVALAEQLRGSIAVLRLEHEGRSLGVTVSIGVAHSMEAGAGRTLSRIADERCYGAKAAGRDCIVAHD